MAQRLSVILSQGQSSNPAKRQLEEDLVAGLMFEPGIEVTVVPHLYDLKPDSTGMLALQGVTGNMVVCSWMFERAAHWILDRNNISGHVGTTLLVNEDDEDDEDEEEELEADDKARVIEQREIPNRRIWCLDLKTTNQSSAFIEEVKRIQSELSVQIVSLGLGGSPSPAQARFDNPTNDTSLNKAGDGLEQNGAATDGNTNGAVNRIEEKAARRWYPVIDYSRCTNCLECIDFCLFGVY
ncbi:MAG: ATP-binding protein, partial [Pirellulaceae bacterium]